MRHADHDLVGAALGGEADRLVEHRHEDVHPLQRELLLAEERASQVLLEALDLRQAAQEREALLGLGLARNRPDSMALRSQTRSAWSEMCSIS